MKVYFRIAEREFFIQTICITSKQKNNGTRRRFESIGKNHGFSPCREYNTRNYECILVLLRGNAHMGSDNLSC